MQLITLGLNHNTAPVEIREMVTFGSDIVVAALRNILTLADIQEAVILSTCNRTEIYVCSSAPAPATADLQRWLAEFHNLELRKVKPFLYLYEDEAAVRHLMKVASGLDSLILGEPQILGQVKTALHTATSAKATGKMLTRLFQHSFTTAKQVRTDTAIGDSPVSVAFAAVSLSRQIFADLSSQTAMLIGAGETIELTARHLKQQGIGKVIVANRTVSRGQVLASQFEGYAIPLSEISTHLHEADIVISSTASPVPVLGKGTVESALKKRRHKPMFMVDIAVPRDIEPEVRSLPDVYLYTVDDLEEVIQENMNSRKEAALQAEEIVGMQATDFMAWVGSLDATSLIQDYRARAEDSRDEVLQKARQMLKNGRDANETLDFLAHTLTNKLLHTPSSQLREAGSTGQKDVLKAANQLFQLKSNKDNP